MISFLPVVLDTFNDLDDLNKTSCRTPCYLKTDCENCTSSSCMWCSNQQKCVETNAYVATFIYGQCMEWTTDKSKCPCKYNYKTKSTELDNHHRQIKVSL